MKEIRHLKTIKNKRNLKTKWLLLQNDKNADTTLLHSHDELARLRSHSDSTSALRAEVSPTTIVSVMEIRFSHGDGLVNLATASLDL